MPRPDPIFECRLARTDAEARAAQALRYAVFVRELGADGPLVDHAAGLEKDAFDDHAKQLLLFDRTRRESAQVVGVYRLLDSDAAQGRFYSEAEYDLGLLHASGRRLLELGRSCLHRDYRGGAAMMHLWQGLAQVVAQTRAEILFGVASFHGTDTAALAQPLSLLRANHLAPPELRVRSRTYAPMDLVPQDRIDRVAAMRATPALIKAYLRLGGMVGDGAFIDHAFNTTDVCLIMDTARLNPRSKTIYTAGAAR